MKTPALLCTLAAIASVPAAQQAAKGQSPEHLYLRVRARVLADVARMPNYTCVQTVRRSVYRSAGTRFRLCDQIIADRKGAAKLQRESWDRLRLDVALVDRREVFSWVGAARFEDAGLHDLVGYGHTSTGEFGPFLLSIFGSHPAMDFAGERQIDGRSLFEYTYATPAVNSEYRIKVGPGEFITPYSGSVLLDPATADVFRITIVSAALPEASGYCQTDNALDYARVRIGANDALIPLSTTSNAIDGDGDEFLNETSYGGCREYVGESRVRFDDDRGQAASASKQLASSAAIPVGLSFESRIITPIDSDTSAMGDPVEAVLRSRIAGSNGRTIVPAGARIHGRLALFGERTSAGKDLFEVGVQFLAIDAGGGRVPFRADLAGAVTGDASGGVGIFRFPGNRLRLRELNAKWVTSAPPRELPVLEFPKF